VTELQRALVLRLYDYVRKPKYGCIPSSTAVFYGDQIGIRLTKLPGYVFFTDGAVDSNEELLEHILVTDIELFFMGLLDRLGATEEERLEFSTRITLELAGNG